MDAQTVVVFSILLQCATAILALRLIPISGGRKAWVMISAGLILMALRRGITLFHGFVNDPLHSADMATELVSLLTSGFMLFGIIWIAPLFLSIKSTTSELQQSEERYRTLFERCRDAIVITNREGAFLDFNHSALELFGYSKEEMVHISAYDVYPRSEDRSKFQQAVESNGSVKDYEVKLRKKDGQEIDCLFSATFDSSSHNNVGGYQVVIRDISEHKRVLDAVVQAKKEWELTFNTVPDSVMILDDQYRMVQVNRTLARMLGISPKAAKGLICYEAIHGLNAPPPYCPHTKLLDDGLEHTVEFYEERLGGHQLVTNSPFFGEEGKVIGGVYVARNISNQKKIQEERERLISELQDALAACRRNPSVAL